MPLSKKRDKERKRRFRLDAKENTRVVQPKLYNPMSHKIGDRVLVQRGKRFIETVIPEIDADGNIIPEY